MQIAVISDIHGNDVAFGAVEADIQKQEIDQIICLGDAVQGGPQPAAVVQRLRTLDCPVVIGNADAWLLSGVMTGSENISPERRKKLDAIREWSLSQLTEYDREFISDFQATVTIPLADGLDVLCFHGSPTSFDDVILPAAPEEEFRKFLGAYSSKVLTGGHTHAQQIRRLADQFFFNPGSVGFSYYHDQSEENPKADPWAEYAILTSEDRKISLEFRRVPFDEKALIQTYKDSGRPFADEAIAQYQR